MYSSRINWLNLYESVEWNASKFVIFLEYENENWFINKLVLVPGILFPENSLLVIENDDSYLVFKIMIYFFSSIHGVLLQYYYIYW